MDIPELADCTRANTSCAREKVAKSSHVLHLESWDWLQTKSSCIKYQIIFTTFWQIYPISTGEVQHRLLPLLSCWCNKYKQQILREMSDIRNIHENSLLGPKICLLHREDVSCADSCYLPSVAMLWGNLKIEDWMPLLVTGTGKSKVSYMQVYPIRLSQVLYEYLCCDYYYQTIDTDLL